MVRKDGLVKVLDFGLAKLTERRSDGAKERLGEDDPTLALPVADSHTTEVGTVMGTASYMSPEQARGEKVDARSDIFSLGVVLYELLAGKRPFEGVNMLDIIGAVLHQEPASLVNAPAEAQRIVTKALQKDRAARYQSAHDFARDLQELKDELAYQARAARTSGETEGLGAQASRLPASEANTLIAANPLSASESAPPASASGTLALPGAARFFGKRNLVLAVAVLAIVAATSFFYFKRQPALTDKDTILLTDFDNKTGDAVFDGTLRQGLAVQLQQSPFLSLLPDERIRATLRLMNKSPDERVTREVGREIALRQGVKAVLAGTIVNFGRNYSLTIEAVNSQSGESLALVQTEAEGKEQVLKALSQAATQMREKLGEAIASIEKFDAPLELTTASLEALKTYSLAVGQYDKGNDYEAISLYKRAIEQDPNFAAPYLALAKYNTNTEAKLAAEYAEKAFALKDRVSEREQVRILCAYYSTVTGEHEKAIELLRAYRQTHPRDDFATSDLAYFYWHTGAFEQAIIESQETLRRRPDWKLYYDGMGYSQLRLNRFAEAKATYKQALQQGFDRTTVRMNLYWLACIDGDTAAQQQHIDWMMGKPDEYSALELQAGSAAFAGQWKGSQDFSQRAIRLATSKEAIGGAAQVAADQSLRATVLGQPAIVKATTTQALALERNQLTIPRVALATALSAQTTQATVLVSELNQRYPKDTFINGIWLPTINATLELQRGNAQAAVTTLEVAKRYEPNAEFWPQYVRGLAYLKLNQAPAAAAEFQKIIDHRGEAPLSVLWPLAHLGLARAAMVQGDTAKAQQWYQAFFALWKDADADLPVLIEAKKEYAKLK